MIYKSYKAIIKFYNRSYGKFIRKKASVEKTKKTDLIFNERLSMGCQITNFSFLKNMKKLEFVSKEEENINF